MTAATKFLADRFPVAEGWCFMDEVTPPMLHREYGDDKPRRFDGIAISLWPSMGEIVHGFEVKVSRSDFLHEIKQPGKAGALMRWCDYWWLVCPPGICQDDEVPSSWGIMYILPSGLRQKRRAPELKPIPRTPDWWRCMLLRKAKRTPVEPEDIAKARQEGWQSGYDSGKETAKHNTSHMEKNYQALVERVDAFEKAADIKLDQWSEHSNAKSAALFRALKGKKYETVAEAADHAADRAEDAAKAMRAASDLINGVTTEAAAT